MSGRKRHTTLSIFTVLTIGLGGYAVSTGCVAAVKRSAAPTAVSANNQAVMASKVTKLRALAEHMKSSNPVSAVLIAIKANQVEATWLKAQGIWGAIGITFNKTPGSPVSVATVVPGGPAQQAGIQVGDKITNIDGFTLAPLATHQTIYMFRGRVGTRPVLTIQRGTGAATTPLTVSVMRTTQSSGMSAVGFKSKTMVNPTSKPSSAKPVEAIELDY